MAVTSLLVMPLLSQSDSLFRPVGPANSGGEEAKRTLLIVDDEEGPRQSLRIVFKDDYRILVADHGVKAIELAEFNHIDAAVLDIRMAGMSGIDLLQRLKQIDPGIEVIMLTAYETIETARQALRLGACDYLNKPFDISTVRSAVAHAMDRRALSNQMRANNQRLLELQNEIRNQKMQEELTRTRGEIYASIIHDINGPLTVISGFIDMINHRIARAPSVEGEDLEIVKDRLFRINRQVTNCIEISRRYLSFLRERASAQNQIGVNQVLADLWELLRFHPSMKQNKLIISPLATDALLEMNGTDLIQILLNLAINSLQCSPEPHEVHVEGELLTQPVNTKDWTAGPADCYVNAENFRSLPPLVALRVRDEGPGIPSVILPRIFESYFTTKTGNQGTGLGLSIVQRLVKEANGALHLHSVSGKGTTFTLYFPARTIRA
jgi:two-component system sensor histidine kinase/response regulator